MSRPKRFRFTASPSLAMDFFQQLQCRRMYKTLAAVVLPCIPLALLIALLVKLGDASGVMSNALLPDQMQNYAWCSPNGSVFAGYLLSYWWLEPAYWVTITLGWGRFTFASVKAIDIAWDWIVGRGWQAISAWIVYVVFRRCWATHWQSAKGAIPAEAAMALQYETAAFPAFCKYLRILWTRSGTSPLVKLDTAVLLFAVVYVLLTPTWLSAMTGYIVPAKPAFRIGTMTLDMNSMERCTLVLVDGDRVGARQNACIPHAGEGQFDMGTYYTTLPAEAYTRPPTQDQINQDSSMPLDGGGNSNITVNGTIYALDAPLLNVSNPWPLPAIGYEGQAYLDDDIQRLGICQSETYYQWGFSFGLSFFFICLTTILGGMLQIIWVCTFRSRELADQVFGSLKTAVVVSAAINTAVGEGSDRMSNAALERARKEQQVAVLLAEKEVPLVERGSDDGIGDVEKPIASTVFVGT